MCIRNKVKQLDYIQRPNISFFAIMPPAIMPMLALWRDSTVYQQAILGRKLTSFME